MSKNNQKLIKSESFRTKLSNLIVFGIVTGVVSTLLAFAPINQNKEWNAPSDACKKANPVSSNTQSIAAGKIIYINSCKSCHGTKGKGDGPKSEELDVNPKDFTKDQFQKQTDGSIFWKVTEGRKPMPSFKKEMTDEQRWQVINYVRTLGVKK